MCAPPVSISRTDRPNRRALWGRHPAERGGRGDRKAVARWGVVTSTTSRDAGRDFDAADNRSGLAGTLARRTEARLRRVFRWPAKALGSFAADGFRAAAGGNRWRLLSVLVA